MKKQQGSNALLIELVIVLFFFILSFAVLSQVFAGAYVTENKASAYSRALHEARNMNALLQTAEDAGQALEEMGSKENGGRWEENALFFDRDGYTLKVDMNREERAAGQLYSWEMTALRDGETLFSLPGALYQPEVTVYE